MEKELNMDESIVLKGIVQGMCLDAYVPLLRAWIQKNDRPVNIALPTDCEHRYAVYCNDMFGTMHMCRVLASGSGLQISHVRGDWHEVFSWAEVLEQTSTDE